MRGCDGEHFFVLFLRQLCDKFGSEILDILRGHIVRPKPNHISSFIIVASEVENFVRNAWLKFWGKGFEHLNLEIVFYFARSPFLNISLGF